MNPGAPALLVDVQLALNEEDNRSDSDIEEPPSPGQLADWAQQAWHFVLTDYAQAKVPDSLLARPAEMTIRLVDAIEMLQLNTQYRNKPGTTNVLSFATDIDAVALTHDEAGSMMPRPLGDVVICHPVVLSEALQQGKPMLAHYAHMVVHGLLHLLGFDHQRDDEAEHMERIETAILAEQGIINPYLDKLAGRAG